MSSLQLLADFAQNPLSAGGTTFVGSVVIALISSTIGTVAGINLHKRGRANDQSDRADDRHADVQQRQNNRDWTMRQRDHEFAQASLDRVYMICAQLDLNPRTSDGLVELGVPQVALDLRQVAHKMQPGDAREKILHLHQQLTRIIDSPLPGGVRDGWQSDTAAVIYAACVQNGESARLIDALPSTRDAITALWGLKA
ncbi:hypothetical protein ACFWN2_04495 [Lentzea sp. NPDC058436]|uniref:hypothetical protein n=1 Tax=Lentzea sp. NPDC058436 TaxID=3346499 RepID=UPI003659A876